MTLPETDSQKRSTSPPTNEQIKRILFEWRNYLDTQGDYLIRTNPIAFNSQPGEDYLRQLLTDINEIYYMSVKGMRGKVSLGIIEDLEDAVSILGGITMDIEYKERRDRGKAYLKETKSLGRLFLKIAEAMFYLKI